MRVKRTLETDRFEARNDLGKIYTIIEETQQTGRISKGMVIPPFLALARNRGQAARANFCLGVMPPRAIFGLS